MRYALGIEYDGSPFQGWQRLGDAVGPDPRTQGPEEHDLKKHDPGKHDPGKRNAAGRDQRRRDAPSVQAEVERALAFVADAPISVTCAGRTDSGVHAACQVVHFDSPVVRDPRGWVLGTTTRLPPAICVRWCVPVADDFHARFAARARRYRYSILNRPVRPALGRGQLGWERRPLDADAMHRAAQALVGEHDFSAFRTVHCQAPHARRDLQRITVQRLGELVTIEVQANAFLHHMVRNIVGSLIPVGAGEQDEGWIAALLAGRDRSLAGPTASPQGLVFLGPLFPAQWGLPDEVTL